MQDDVPKLHNKPAFEVILKNYQISGHAREVLAATPFVALSGLAGGGRNTVIRRLVETGPYLFSVSDTTRPPKFRDGQMEQDGVNYYFRKEEDMLREIQEGEFVEAEIIHNQQVSGTSIREIERAIALKKIPINDFEYGGANAVAMAKPDADIIALLPPNYEEWMRRLTSREEMSQQEFTNRLVTAKHVLENMLTKPYFKFVINDTVDDCVRTIRHIVEDKEYTRDMDDRGKAIAGDILQHVNDVLSHS